MTVFILLYVNEPSPDSDLNSLK